MATVVLLRCLILCCCVNEYLGFHFFLCLKRICLRVEGLSGPLQRVHVDVDRDGLRCFGYSSCI